MYESHTPEYAGTPSINPGRHSIRGALALMFTSIFRQAMVVPGAGAGVGGTVAVSFTEGVSSSNEVNISSWRHWKVNRTAARAKFGAEQ